MTAEQAQQLIDAVHFYGTCISLGIGVVAGLFTVRMVMLAKNQSKLF